MIPIAQVLKFEDDEHRERLVWINGPAQGGWFIDIDCKRALPIFRSWDDIEDLMRDRVLEETPDPWVHHGQTLSEVQKARRDEAWALLHPLTLEHPQLFHPRTRMALIKARAEEADTTRQKLFRLLRRWWQRGMTIAAIGPDYAKSGGAGKTRAPSSKKRGAKPQHGLEGVNVDEHTRAAMTDSVTRYFAKNKRIEVSACYELFLRDHFCDLALDEATGRQDHVLRDAHPSLRQFRYWMEKDNDLFALSRKRRTPRVYDKDNRALLSTSLDEVIGPGSRYQIDATVADIYLVSRFDRSKIVGRPVIYVIVDVFSRMISGLYVGFEAPSWVGAMMALANAASPKTEWCQSLGLEISDADWPCQSLPGAILADRGEMLGKAAETLVERFGVRIENTAPYRADWKGIVERRFGLLHAKFGPYTPGYVEPDFRERGAKDYRLDATLDLDEFTRIIATILLYYNTEHLIEGYKRSPEMIAEDVPAIPVALWEWGIQRRIGLQRQFPEDLVKLALLPADKARVTAKGIRFYGNYYSCARAIEEHRFEKARQTGGWNVDISYEPRCMDTIWLRDLKGAEPFLPCNLTKPCEDMRGRTLWEIDHIRSEDRRQKAAYTPGQLKARINLTEHINEIVQTAQDKKPKDTRSKAERVRDIRANRAEERDANRCREAFKFGHPPAQEANILPFDRSETLDEDKYATPSIAHIRQRFHEDKEDGDD